MKTRKRFFNRACWLWLTALCLVVALSGTAWAQNQDKLTDASITGAVEDELFYDPAVPLNEIDISTTDGIVTLTGTANNLLARRRATHVTETVKGVKSVINRIDIQPSTDRSDSAIRADVTTALLSDAATDSFEIDVSVDDDAVTLTGTVQSWQEKQLAEKVAMGVKGVRGIENNIKVNYKTDRPDAELKPEIRKALRWDTLVDDALIDVSVDDGKVRLSGIVGSAAEKTRAISDAWVAGVRSVDAAELDVRKWARDEDLRKHKYQSRSAKQIKQAIEDALLVDPRVYSFNVTPEVQGSLVTLRGTVDNLKAKRAAANVARNTVGVNLVKNRLKVRTTDRIDDKTIAEDIRQSLTWDPFVDRYEITVTVIDGTAHLYGEVDSWFEKGQADDIASRVNGVKEVDNNLDVDTDDIPLTWDPYVYEDYPYDTLWYDYEPTYTFASDAEIRDEVNDELWWSPFVDSDEVNVSVDEGVVTLTGTVDSWSERSAATENAYEGGAVWVYNNLTVK